MTTETTGNGTGQDSGQGSQQAPQDGSQVNPAPTETPGGQNTPDEWAGRFAALTKKEKHIQAQKKQFDAERAELEDLRRAKGLAKTAPKEFLQAHGLTYEELTEIILSNKEQDAKALDPVAKLQKQLDDDLAERNREKEEAIAQQQQAAIDGHRLAIRSHIESTGDKYEMIAAEDAYDTVFEVIEEHFEQTDELMPIDRACQLVDAFLTEKAKKALGLKRFQPQTETPKDDRPQPYRSPTSESFTLTNNNVASPPQASNRGEKISNEEAKRRAADKIQWN